jgi:hypothetical protein
MNATRASESQTLRQEVAQLLRRLRAIRQDGTSQDEQADRMQRELIKAGRVSSFIFFRRRSSSADPVPAVDHSKLRAASETAA